MKNLKKLGSVLEKLYMGVGAVAMGLLAFLVIFTVIMRYCFSLSWKSVSEFNVLLFTFTTFWGLGLNVLKNEHVSVTIPYDTLKPSVTSGIRVGTAAMTTRGFREAEFIQVGKWISEALKNRTDHAVLERIGNEVVYMTERFPFE